MPTIHLQVCAGFANRLRVLVSGLCVAEDYGVPVVVHWNPFSPECFCGLETVIDSESLPKTVKVVPTNLFQASQLTSRDAWLTLYENWDKTSDLCIKSYSIFYTNKNYEALLRQIKPSRAVEQFLEKRTSRVDWSKAIGVHIRRTDNQKSIEGSPLEKFLQKMRENKSAMYLVATDDGNVKEQIMIEMGDRCVFPATVLTRKTEEGMIHGVADFFALAKCPMIWGSYWSSFSEIAAMYGASELLIV